MKRFVLTAVAVLALALVGPSAVALADDDEDDGGAVATRTVTFTMTSAACKNLPANTTINGTGTEKSVTTITTSRGVTTIRNSTNTRGTATDGNGHTYRFIYSNRFRISNSASNPGSFSGWMVDAFSLSGNGPARLHSGFVTRLTTDPDFTFVTWDPVFSFGDPISFAPGAIVQHCDPL
jgi:hypothetical protein